MSMASQLALYSHVLLDVTVHQWKLLQASVALPVDASISSAHTVTDKRFIDRYIYIFTAITDWMSSPQGEMSMVLGH